MIQHIHPDGEPTPTVQELYERKDGSAEAVTWSADKKPVPTKFRLLPKGQALLGEIMRRNAAGTLARGTAAQEATDRLIQARNERNETEKKGKSNGRKSSWTAA